MQTQEIALKYAYHRHICAFSMYIFIHAMSYAYTGIFRTYILTYMYTEYGHTKVRTFVCH